jgi:hypothetical protein
MSPLVNSLNIGAVASQANGGSSLQFCGYEFESWTVHDNYKFYSVGIFV